LRFQDARPFQEFAARNPPARVGVVAREKLFTDLLVVEKTVLPKAQHLRIIIRSIAIPLRAFHAILAFSIESGIFETKPYETSGSG
jgi:hypothetical protein